MLNNPVLSEGLGVKNLMKVAKHLNVGTFVCDLVLWHANTFNSILMSFSTFEQ